MFRNNLFLLAMGLGLCSQAHALESDKSQPIKIEADQGSLDQKNQVTTFSGNVVIAQGTLNIRAGKVTVRKDAAGNQSMEASGSPVTFSQKMDNGQTVNGQGEQVRYTSASGLVTLTGNARVERQGDLAQGAVITYNMRTSVYTVAGNKAASGSGRRVTIILQPTGKK